VCLDWDGGGQESEIWMPEDGSGPVEDAWPAEAPSPVSELSEPRLEMRSTMRQHFVFLWLRRDEDCCGWRDCAAKREIFC
jgi:hypothetical protein